MECKVFWDLVCEKCGKKGHVREVCQSKAKQRSRSGSGDRALSRTKSPGRVNSIFAAASLSKDELRLILKAEVREKRIEGRVELASAQVTPNGNLIVRILVDDVGELSLIHI